MWTGSVSTGFRLYFYCGPVEFLLIPPHSSRNSLIFPFGQFFFFFNATCLNVLRLCFDKYSWNNANELTSQCVIGGCGVFMSENSQFFLLNWMSSYTLQQTWKLNQISSSKKKNKSPHSESLSDRNPIFQEACTGGICLVTWYGCLVVTSASKYEPTVWARVLKAQLCGKLTLISHVSVGEQLKAQSLGGN